jgi:hypothetical protein
MEIGLLIRWGKIVPGREEEAVELFQTKTQYYADLVAKGRLTFFEPYLFSMSDIEEEMGLILLKGPAPEIFRLMEDDEYLRLMQKSALLVEHLKVNLLTVGEGIPETIERFRKVRAELGA